jgi:hypothetical protein
MGHATAVDGPWVGLCDRVQRLAPPPADLPDDAAKRTLKGCTSEELYYGIGQAADPAKARLCAYLELAAGNYPLFGGSAILMTIYATGHGARTPRKASSRDRLRLRASPHAAKRRRSRVPDATF